ncbi:MAG: plasmid replication protein RepC [Pseudomonadota bacterium]
MTYDPITPFRRPVDAALMEHRNAARTPLPPQGVNKWEILRELGVARKALGVSDRELAVLQALLSFYPATILGGNADGLVIHPSNASICERLNGMPCSTMRRHLSRLVQAGLLLRRDSPNGKRYARRYGAEKEVFGFCLSPLLRRHREVCALAEAVRAAEEQKSRLRQRVSLMLRDLAALAVYGHETRPDHAGLWDRLEDMARLSARCLRRRLEMSDLEGVEREAAQGLSEARAVLDGLQEMSTKEHQPEHHYQSSNTDSNDLEPCFDKAVAPPAHGAGTEPKAEESRHQGVENSPRKTEPSVGVPEAPGAEPSRRPPAIPLQLVVRACAEVKSYVPDRISHWHELVGVADRLRPMMGISPSAWEEAKEVMGLEEAAVVVLAILERFDEIRSPGGYLRHLTRKAADRAFSSGPMVMALLQRQAG